MLGSFKHKLAVYFLLLAVVPLTAAFWGFGMLAKRAEERRVDSRLAAELRAVVASYGRQTDRVRILARDLARRRDVQTAIRTGRHGGLPRNVRVIGGPRLARGPRGAPQTLEAIRVRAGRRVLGTIVALLPLDQTLLQTLRSESALSRGDKIVFLPRSERTGRQALAPGRP